MRLMDSGSKTLGRSRFAAKENTRRHSYFEVNLRKGRSCDRPYCTFAFARMNSSTSFFNRACALRSM